LHPPYPCPERAGRYNLREAPHYPESAGESSLADFLVFGGRPAGTPERVHADYTPAVTTKSKIPADSSLP